MKAPMYRVPLTTLEKMISFVENASPTLQHDIMQASIAVNGKPRDSALLSFLDYAVNMVFTNAEKPATPARFGSRIESDVDEIVRANRAAYADNPEAWHLLTAIGSTLLRDKGHNPVSVRKWIDANADKLAAHHAEVGITDPVNHNRKAGKARKLLGIQ